MKIVLIIFITFFLISQIPANGADFNGDGTADIAVFRPSTGLWVIRGVARCYYGRTGDNPVPNDYNGDGRLDIAIYRPATGLWAIRDITRTYFGTGGDIPFSGSGTSYNPEHFYIDPTTGYVGIKTDKPSVELEMGKWADGVDVIFHGSEASGDSRLIWDGDRAALRFGGHSSQWDEDTPGDFSLSVGYDTTARGGCSAAIGDLASTTGGGSLAVGYAVNAGGTNSMAVGSFIITDGWQSMALGSYVSAQADNSIVIGRGTGDHFPYGLANNIPDSLMIGFNTDTDPAFFVDSDSVGIRTTTPARALHVKDVMRLEPRDTAPDNPDEGDLYYDSTIHKLKCYDGSSWQDCF